LQGYTSVAGGVTHLYGSNVKTEAISYSGYRFVKWTLAVDTSIIFSTYPIVSFTAVRDTNIIAHFEKENYNITVEVNSDIAGTVTFNDETSVQINTAVPFDSTITVYAQSLRGYRFLHWLNGSTVVSEDTFYSVTVTQQTVITAVFEANLYEVSLSGSSFGSVEGSGMYPYGSVVNIAAIPNSNYFFNRWISVSAYGNEFISFDSVYSFVITGDTAFTAIFRTDTFNITADASYGGSIVSGTGRFLFGQEVNLQAEADYGYIFSEWQNDSGIVASSSNPFVFNASANVSLHAIFVPQIFSVNINTNASSSNVRGMGNYRYGDDAYLFAFSDDIYTFTHWELSDSAIFTEEELLNNMLFYSVEKDLEIRAIYQTKSYNVTSSISPVASGSVFNTGVYFHGSSFTLEAIPAEHYHFVHWLLNGEFMSSERYLQVDSVNSDLEFIAVFELDRHSVTLTCYPSSGGTLNGGGVYTYGDTATLSITLNPGYVLNEWRDELFKIVANTASFKYAVTRDSYITAALNALATEPFSDFDAVRVYPNPVSAGGVLYVDGLENGVAMLYDFTGKVMLKTNRNPIQIKDIPQGIYLLRITLSNGAVVTEKVIVR
jgi:hypothetical protein